MTDLVLPAPPAHRSEPASVRSAARAAPVPGRLGAAIVLLSAIAALAAFGGGVALLLDPDGSLLGFSPALLEGTPFGSYRIPAVGLLFLGALQTASVVVAVRRRHEAWPVPFVAGTALAAWTAVQVALIGPVSWMQALVWLLGFGIAACAFALSVERTADGASAISRRGDVDAAARASRAR